MSTSQISLRKYRDPERIPQRVADHLRDKTESIRRRAFDLFLSRNGDGGSDLEDWLQAEREIDWSPPSELVEDEYEYRARIAIAGFDAKDLEVCALPDALIVEAGKCHSHEELDGNVRFCEFSGKSMFRRIELPTPVDVDQVTARVDDGILQVNAPKAAVRHRMVSRELLANRETF